MSLPAVACERPVDQGNQNTGLLTPAEIEQFARDGFVVVRGLAAESLRREMLDVTLDHLAREVGPIEYEADLHYPGAPSSRACEGGRTVRRLKQAHSRHAVFTEWISSPELIGRLRQLLAAERRVGFQPAGEEQRAGFFDSNELDGRAGSLPYGGADGTRSVPATLADGTRSVPATLPHVVMPLAHHNCIMTKQPRYSSETGWHQDIRYWSFQRPELVNAWLALGRENPENGCLRLIPGSHRMAFDRSRYDEALFFRTDLPENQELIGTAVEAWLEPGDVLFFHCRTFHAASRNDSAEPKLSVVFTFRPDDNPPVPGTRSASMPEILLPAVGSGA